MPRQLPATAAAFALTGTLLLAACGTQQAGPGSRPGAPSLSEAGLCEKLLASTGSPVPPDASATTGQPGAGGSGTGEPGAGEPGSEDDTDGARLLGLPGCQVFEVTNTLDRTATVTITYSLLDSDGGTLANSSQTVASLAPGRTVRRAVAREGAVRSGGDMRAVKIIKVRSVPSAEAPSQSGPCPASGVHVYADQGDAAMGLRVVGLHLRNCGTHPYVLDGYPQLQLLDDAHHAVAAVKILHGGDAIAMGTGADGAPQRLVLQPGDGARTSLVWRNTTLQGGDPVNAPYVRVRPEPGAAPVTVTPELDLGTTGRLGVGPWKSEATGR